MNDKHLHLFPLYPPLFTHVSPILFFLSRTFLELNGAEGIFLPPLSQCTGIFFECLSPILDRSLYVALYEKKKEKICITVLQYVVTFQHGSCYRVTKKKREKPI